MTCGGCGSKKAIAVNIRFIEGEKVEVCNDCGNVSLAWPEIVPAGTKEDRKKYFKSTLQPYRDGEPAKEFVEAYPERAKKMWSKEKRAKAKYKWKSLPGWKDRAKSE